ncbi:hypothetical protein DL767_005370 [Monosporascus sp. MG133]|nr:hypothetical protein DL767_005370 [Monosporascus sp. MG133]
MLRFIKKYLTFALIAAPAVQAVAGFNATDNLKASQLATSPMASATSTAKSSLDLSYGTAEAKAEVSTSLDTARQLNVNVTCDDITLHTSLGHKLLRTRFPKKKGGHSKSDGGDEESSVCQEEESPDHLSTAATAGIIVGCIVGATIIATTLAIVIHLRRGDKSSVDVEKASGEALTTTQVPANDSTDAGGYSPPESTLSPSPDITTASTNACSASAGQYNATITCNGDAPESYKVRSFGGRKGGHPKHKGGDGGEEDSEKEEGSLCQEPSASPQLSTAVIVAIVVGCVLGTAILVAAIAFIIAVVRCRNRSHAAVKKLQFDATAVSTSSLETGRHDPNGMVV